MIDRPATLERARRRGAAYWFEDGLTELVFGPWWVLFGTVYLAGAADPATGGIVILVGTFVVTLGLLVCQASVRRLKAHLTYPRTGYAEQRSPPVAVGVLIGLAGPALILVAAGVVALASQRWTSVPDVRSPFWAPVSVGTIVVLGAAGAVAISRQARFAAAGVVGALGVALPAVGLAGYVAVGLICVAVGAVEAVSGAVTLRRYLRRHPRPGAEGA